MTRLRRLILEVRESSNGRGHTMTRFSYYGQDLKHPVTAVSVCTVCRAGVYVLVNPQPNQIEIGGSAVALHCPIDSHKKEEKP